MTTWRIKILSTCLYILTSNSATWAINGYHKIHFLTFERAKRMKTSILSNDLPPMTASPWHFAPLQVGPHIWTSAARHSAHSACEWRPCIWACSWRKCFKVDQITLLVTCWKTSLRAKSTIQMRSEVAKFHHRRNAPCYGWNHPTSFNHQLLKVATSHPETIPETSHHRDPRCKDSNWFIWKNAKLTHVAKIPMEMPLHKPPRAK